MCKEKCNKCGIDSCNECTGCENIICDDFNTCDCKKCEWVEEAKSLSDEELSDKIENYVNALHFLRDLRDNRRFNEYPFDNKYIKVFGCNGDGPEYIKCDYCCVSSDPGCSGKQLYFKGIGFSGEFGPYEDSNYVHFTTWDDHYLPLNNYIEKETKRSEGKIKEGDYDWNSYRVDIITEEEYIEAFNKMLDNMKSTFFEFVKNE